MQSHYLALFSRFSAADLAGCCTEHRNTGNVSNVFLDYNYQILGVIAVTAFKLLGGTGIQTAPLSLLLGTPVVDIL